MMDRLFLNKLRFFRPKGEKHGCREEKTADNWAEIRCGQRGWEDFYRRRWQYDKKVRSTHGVNCTGSCSWDVYVKNGILVWETQCTDYPASGDGYPNHEPRGCPRGATYSWYTYSPVRLKYPLVRSSLMEMWQDALRQNQDPVTAWQSIVDDPEKRQRFLQDRGKGGFVRASWEQAATLIAASLIHTIQAYGPDRIFGYAFYSPRYPDDMPEEMKRCSAGGLKGLKIHPDFHRTPADSPLYDPVYQLAEKEHRVILCHYGAGKGPFAGSHIYNRVVRKYPDAVYVMAHSLPGFEAVDTAVEYFGDNPNVNFCLANAFEPGVIEYACEQIGEKRLLFGSDGGWGSVATRLGLICCTDVPLETKRKRTPPHEKDRGSHPSL